MKIYATIKVPERVSFDEIRDIGYTKTISHRHTIEEITRWARDILITKSDDGPGTKPEKLTNEQVFMQVKFTRDYD